MAFLHPHPTQRGSVPRPLPHPPGSPWRVRTRQTGCPQCAILAVSVCPRLCVIPARPLYRRVGPGGITPRVGTMLSVQVRTGLGTSLKFLANHIAQISGLSHLLGLEYFPDLPPWANYSLTIIWILICWCKLIWMQICILVSEAEQNTTQGQSIHYPAICLQRMFLFF